nr:TetR/AcrR family transcriptional regulator [Allorhizobium sonneratiae]
MEAAKAAFAEQGVDVPVRDIAARAGVGIGTLYRRFPKRSDLVAAVFRQQVDACAKEAAALAAIHAPVEALILWLRRYLQFLAAKKGLTSALHSGDPAYDSLPDYFRGNFEPALSMLMQRAVAAGDIREGIDPYDLLRVVGGLSAAAHGEEDFLERMFALVIDGLRYRA